MINNTILIMIGALNAKTHHTLNIISNCTLTTSEFKDLDALVELYDAGWIDGVSKDHEDECYWIMTNAGRKLFNILADVVV